MQLSEFIESLDLSSPLDNSSPFLIALWHDKKNDWVQAHKIIQDIAGGEAAWIHAYLHRKEGDFWNADYWYRMANKKRPTYSLDKEWQKLVYYFLVKEKK